MGSDIAADEAAMDRRIMDQQRRGTVPKVDLQLEAEMDTDPQQLLAAIRRLSHAQTDVARARQALRVVEKVEGQARDELVGVLRILGVQVGI